MAAVGALDRQKFCKVMQNQWCAAAHHHTSRALPPPRRGRQPRPDGSCGRRSRNLLLMALLQLALLLAGGFAGVNSMSCLRKAPEPESDRLDIDCELRRSRSWRQPVRNCRVLTCTGCPPGLAGDSCTRVTMSWSN